jgi:hypothetical protein
MLVVAGDGATVEPVPPVAVVYQRRLVPEVTPVASETGVAP